MLSEEDKQSEEIQRSIDCIFEDFDVDCDGKLVRSFTKKKNHFDDVKLCCYP
jgi:hypothetical protein